MEAPCRTRLLPSVVTADPVQSRDVLSYTVGTTRYDELTLSVPLDRRDPSDRRTIDIVARVITARGGSDRPYVVFLQGGPGVEAPRPAFAPTDPSWLAVALERYRVVLLDQRGTGRSAPVSDGLLVGRSAAEVAEYLTHLRADEIVGDCEDVRRSLGAQQWSVLGQSFGGFTALAYATTNPDSIDRAYLTGGLSAVGRPVDDIYSRTWHAMAAKSREHYDRFSEDRTKVRRLLAMADAGRIVLPNGDVVSSSRLRSLGHLLGSDQGTWAVHGLLDLEPSSNVFRHDLARLLPFGGRNPLYAVIHESSYADGYVTNWSAMRTRPAAFDEDPTLLVGEHIDRAWFAESSDLRPWAEVADLVAQHPWPALYDAQALRASGLTGAAAVYVNDAYVPLDLSLETAALLPGVATYVTSEYEHSGLRTSGGAVLRRLIALADGELLR